MAASTAEEQDCRHLFGYGDASHKQSKLQEITAQRQLDVAEARKSCSAEDLEKVAKELVAELGPTRSLLERISEAEVGPWRLALCAEFKRASPSKGDIAVGLKAGAQAQSYAEVGAAVISVLTEPTWFKGSLKDLREAREQTQRWAESCGKPRPLLLRKDFTVDEYQVLEALAHGADTILLMVSVLSVSKLRFLIQFCRERGMEPLVEVASSVELAIAVEVGAAVIGVNNRDLHTLTLDAERTNRLGRELREDLKVAFGPGTQVKLLALSGLATAADVDGCRTVPCSGILVGEALMRAVDTAASIRAMMGSSSQPEDIVVKVCGVTRSEDAKVAMQAGANLIGLIFAKSKRTPSAQQLADVITAVREHGERTAVVPRAAEGDVGLADTARIAARARTFRAACCRQPLAVGVFLDQPLDDVAARANEAGLDVVQLHGGESLDFVTLLRQQLPETWLMKVLHLPPRGGDSCDSAAALAELKTKAEAYGNVCDVLLLDTALPGASKAGGTGATFDWEVVKTVQECWGMPVLVAGGLTESNVAELVHCCKPFGVDVSSGVEDGTSGVKSAELTSGYVRNAKLARMG